jgi:hypothetical protein
VNGRALGLGFHGRVALALACFGALILAPGLASAATETLSFTPVADTYVDASLPSSSFGSSVSMYDDASPVKQSFVRFNVTGLSGRPVLDARLRLYNKDSSPQGGRVWSIASNSWSEGMTWDSRPAIDGPLLGQYGAVQSGNWYEADLGQFPGGDGTVSLAIDSTNTDGAKWGTRESANPPRLLVDVEMGTQIHDGLSEVAAPTVGSSDPTYLPINHRVALTSEGRTLVLHGRHADGVQLAWRDRFGTGWHTQTTGAVSDGRLLSGTGTGDWPASIAIARDSAGTQHAWVVWGRTSYTYLKPVQMVRLSDLDDPAGPRVGQTVTVDAAPTGAYRPDIAFESASGGDKRGAVIWSRCGEDAVCELHAAWFTDLDSDTPVLHDESVLTAASTYARWGRLVPTAAGMRVAARGPSSRLTIYSHDARAALGSWTAGAGGVGVADNGPTAVALDSGEILTATETNTTNHVLTVQRFSPAGAPAPPELQLTGYAQPTLTTDGTSAWLVMIRKSDGYVVSRRLVPGSGWSGADRVEIGAEGGGNYAYPNAMRRVSARLRFVVRGPAGGATRSAVLAWQRVLP